jgi:hypothetical protein
MRNFEQAICGNMGKRFIAGRIDSAPGRIEVGCLHATRWIRSNLFVIDDAALTSINHAIYAPELNSSIKDSPHEDTFFGATVAASLRSHLSDWLFSAGPVTWYKAEPLSSANHLRMASKARCIVQELYLSMRLEDAGTRFVQPPPLSIVEKIAVRAGYTY